MWVEEAMRQIIKDGMDLLEPFGIKPSPQAAAMLEAIGQQESGFRVRDQIEMANVLGPATGFWQFERNGGVAGVLTHERTEHIAAQICRRFGLEPEPRAVWTAFTAPAYDVLAAAFARLLLWSDPRPLPLATEGAEEEAWQCYERNWRPGKPHRERWTASWRQGLQSLSGVEPTEALQLLREVEDKLARVRALLERR